MTDDAVRRHRAGPRPGTTKPSPWSWSPTSRARPWPGASTGCAPRGPRELVVVDNGSADGSVDEVRRRFPEVEVVVPGRNLGYGAAANRGVAATTEPLVLVCNSDLEVGPGALAILAAVLAGEPGCALVGPLIRNRDGTPVSVGPPVPHAGRRRRACLVGDLRPRQPIHPLLPPGHRRAGRAGDPSWWTGCQGRAFWSGGRPSSRWGGSTRRTSCTLEDVDLCWRLGRAGWTVAYLPTAEVTHLQGVSTDRHPFRMILEHHRSLLRFAGRSSRGWRRALLPLVALGIGARACLACLAQRHPPMTGATGAPDPRL